jgi:preprotein translocase subunit SecG
MDPAIATIVAAVIFAAASIAVAMITSRAKKSNAPTHVDQTTPEMPAERNRTRRK